MTSQSIRSYGPLVGPLFLPSFFLALLLGIALPVLPLFLQALGASYVAIGTIISAHPIGMLIAALPGSGVLSRLSMRSAMLLGCTVVTISLVVLYNAPTNVTIFLSWMFVGMGTVLYELARHQYIVFRIDNQFRGRAVAITGGLARFAAVLGPIVGGGVAQAYDFRTPFLLMAGCALVTASIVYFSVPYLPLDQTANTASFQGYMAELWDSLRQHWRLLAAAGSGQVLIQLVRRSRPVLIPLVAANILGMNVATVGIVMGIGSTLDTVMFWPAGLIMDKYGRKAAIVPSLVLRAIGFFLLPFTVGFWSIVAVAGLIGFSNGLSSGTMITLGADLAPEERPIPFLGLWRVSSSFGFTLGPNAVGVIAQFFTLAPASIAVGLISLLAATLFWQFVPETLKRPVAH